MNDASAVKSATAIPFDAAKLDAILDRAGIDALIVSSKHNIQYLLGGYRFFFFEHFDAIGVGRYTPLLVYQRGHVERTRYIGNGMERYEKDLGVLWSPDFVSSALYGPKAMAAAVEHLKKSGMGAKTIAVERAFLGADAEEVLRKEMPGGRIVDALVALEDLRAVKSPQELQYLREASEKVVDSMLAVMAGHGPGTSTRALVDAMRLEEIERGLEFDYCLVTAGASLNRAPSDRLIWGEGDPLTLDSGGNIKGYIGDVCRMAIHGEPDAELIDLLGTVEEIQQASRKPIRAGARGGDIYDAVDGLLRRSPHGNLLEFVAHGMGLISHEAPRLTDKGPIPYPADAVDKPLEAGMVLSIETTLPHPKRGYIKLEDTLAVTADGWEAFGDHGRGWNRGGTAA
ncbi:MAG TPA: Xaa-Pro peptidase family protein [Bauldia sp.]